MNRGDIPEIRNQKLSQNQVKIISVGILINCITFIFLRTLMEKLFKAEISVMGSTYCTWNIR